MLGESSLPTTTTPPIHQHTRRYRHNDVTGHDELQPMTSAQNNVALLSNTSPPTAAPDAPGVIVRFHSCPSCYSLLPPLGETQIRQAIVSTHYTKSPRPRRCIWYMSVPRCHLVECCCSLWPKPEHAFVIVGLHREYPGSTTPTSIHGLLSTALVSSSIRGIPMWMARGSFYGCPPASNVFLRCSTSIAYADSLARYIASIGLSPSDSHPSQYKGKCIIPDDFEDDIVCYNRRPCDRTCSAPMVLVHISLAIYCRFYLPDTR